MKIRYLALALFLTPSAHAQECSGLKVILREPVKQDVFDQFVADTKPNEVIKEDQHIVLLYDQDKIKPARRAYFDKYKDLGLFKFLGPDCRKDNK